MPHVSSSKMSLTELLLSILQTELKDVKMLRGKIFFPRRHEQIMDRTSIVRQIVLKAVHTDTGAHDEGSFAVRMKPNSYHSTTH